MPVSPVNDEEPSIEELKEKKRSLIAQAYF
jgi:hypothetical protein